MHPLYGVSHKIAVLWVYGGQILFKGWSSLLRIQAINLEQLLRPVLKKTRGVKCPTSHIGKALPLSEIKFVFLKRLLCALAISDVLDCTVEVGGSARLVFLYSTRTVEDAHFAPGTNDAVFHVIAHTSSIGLLLFTKITVTLYRMIHVTVSTHL